MKISNFEFEALESFNEGFNKKKEFAKAEQTRTSPQLETSIGPAEPPIDLKLGKRTYFEINCVGSSAKASTFSVDPLFSTATTKKIKPSSQSTLPPRCQVEGCNLDLSRAKEYHRKHKVCESHSKCPKVIVNGQERRFCQQCSRFHSLSEFDEKKRSCRRRLSDHNARRRKPQLEAIQFNSTKLSSSFYGGEQKLSFELSNGPLVHTRPPANSTWESTYGLKFTPTKGCVLKPLKSGGVEDQPHLQDFGLPHAISMLNSVSNIHSACKDTAAEVFNQDSKESIFSSNLAHSLLSTNSWGSQAESITFSHPMHVDDTKMPQTAVREVPQAPANVSSDYWQTEEQSFDSHAHTLTANSNGGHHFQESKLFREAYLTGFYSNHMN